MLKLTQKLARTLIAREIGVPARNLEKIAAPDGVYAYQMSLGGLDVKVENDRYTHIGRYGLEIHDRLGGTMMTMLFHPDTLNRDFGAEDAEKTYAAQQTRREWVQYNGPDYCHKMVDVYWNS